jgi:hypothetical protein
MTIVTMTIAVIMNPQLLQAPSVVVSYTTNPDIKTGKAFADIGVQIAAGVPLQVDALLLSIADG